MTDATLLKKVEELSARVVTLEAENIRVNQENSRLQNENRLLRQKLDQYIRHYFGGQRNEGLEKQQLELLLQGLPNVIALPTPEPKPAVASRSGTPHPVRRMLAEDKLETQEIVIEPEEVKAQPDGWKKISEERTSQLDWVAPKIIKRVFIRPRYVKAERFAIAPLPPQPIEQGMVGPALLAEVLINKFEYHIPLFRQEKMFRQQFGVELSRKPEQIQALFSGILIVAKSVCDTHRLPAASVNFVSLIHGIHEADVVSIVLAGVNPKFV